MTTASGTTFLAFLTLAAQAVLLVGGALFVSSLVSRRAASRWAEVRAAVGPHAVMLAFIVAAVATAGSLWLSEGAHFLPCKLCWYQRIAMYPLAPILLVAVLRRDITVRPYALTVALLALPLSTYHYVLERIPSLESGVCDPSNPCTIVWVWKFHYVSIPLMAGTAFILIAALLAIARPAEPVHAEGVTLSHGNA